MTTKCKCGGKTIKVNPKKSSKATPKKVNVTKKKVDPKKQSDASKAASKAATKVANKNATACKCS